MHPQLNPIEYAKFNQTLLVDSFGQSYVFLPMLHEHASHGWARLHHHIDQYWIKSLLQEHSPMWGHTFSLDKLYYQISNDYLAHYKSRQDKIIWLSNHIASGQLNVYKAENFASPPPSSAIGGLPTAAIPKAASSNSPQKKSTTSLGQGGYTSSVPASLSSPETLPGATNNTPHESHPHVAEPGLLPGTQTAKATSVIPECHRDEFTIHCGHGSRGYLFNILHRQTDNPKMRFAVVGKDTITVKQQGSCAHGSATCPAVKVTGPDISTIKSAANFQFSVKAPSRDGNNIANLKDFLGALVNGYDSYQSYQLQAQGCDPTQAKAEVWAYDPYQWDGRLTLGYNKKWEVTSSLKGKMGASEWSLETASADNSFSNFLNQLNDIIKQVKSWVGQADGGHGYETFKSGFTAPKLSIGGGLKLAERDASPDVGLQGNLDLKFEPLIGFNFTCDIVTAVIRAVYPSKLADPILEARKAVKNGIQLGDGKVKASANVEIQFTIDGRVDSLLGWEFKPDGSCLPTQGADASKVETGIGIGLKAVTDAKVEVFIISVQIGSEIKAEGAEGAQGVGLLFSAYATEIDNKPSMAGKAVFSGIKLVYSYHAKVMAKGSGTQNSQRRRRSENKMGLNLSTEKKVSGEKVLLEPITIFNTGSSAQGATLDNVNL